MTATDASPSGDGVHYLVYKQDQELHTLSWLNPEIFGPFDHTWEVSGSATEDAKGADILCTDEDGDLVDDLLRWCKGCTRRNPLQGDCY